MKLTPAGFLLSQAVSGTGFHACRPARDQRLSGGDVGAIGLTAAFGNGLLIDSLVFADGYESHLCFINELDDHPAIISYNKGMVTLQFS
jgi:hypothetical protein